MAQVATMYENLFPVENEAEMAEALRWHHANDDADIYGDVCGCERVCEGICEQPFPKRNIPIKKHNNALIRCWYIRILVRIIRSRCTLVAVSLAPSQPYFEPYNNVWHTGNENTLDWRKENMALCLQYHDWLCATQIFLLLLLRPEKKENEIAMARSAVIYVQHKAICRNLM